MNMKMQKLVLSLLVLTSSMHAMSPRQKYTCISITSLLAGAAGYAFAKEAKKEAAGDATAVGAALGYWGCSKLSSANQVEQGWNDMREADRVFGEVRRLCLSKDVFSYSNKVAGVADNSWSLGQAMETLTLCKTQSIVAKELADKASLKGFSFATSVDAFKSEVSEGEAVIDGLIKDMSRRQGMNKQSGHQEQHDECSKFLWLQTHREWREKVAAGAKRPIKN